MSTYNANTGAPVTLAGDDVYVAASGFDNRNRLVSRQLGDPSGAHQVVRTYGYDNHQRLTDWVATTGGTTLQDDWVTFDQIGNVTARRDARTGTDQWECFDHDQRSRLTRAYTTTSGCGSGHGAGPYGYDEAYTYAPDNKLLSRDTGDGPLSYTYPAQGSGSVRPHAVTAVGPDTYTYDLNGLMVTRPGTHGQQTLVWDNEHRLTQLTDGPGLRLTSARRVPREMTQGWLSLRII